MESKDGEVTGSKETQGPTSPPLAWVDDGELAAHLAQPSLRDWRELEVSVVEPRRRVPGMRKASSRFHRSARGYGSSTPQPRGPCQEASVEKASQAAVGRA